MLTPFAVTEVNAEGRGQGLRFERALKLAAQQTLEVPDRPESTGATPDIESVLPHLVLGIRRASAIDGLDAKPNRNIQRDLTCRGQQARSSPKSRMNSRPDCVPLISFIAQPHGPELGQVRMTRVPS